LNTQHTLEKLGLTKGEIAVYLTLLKYDSTTVGSIIKQSKVSSSKVYIILDKLIDKGLATYILKERTKYFQANPPETLTDYANKQEQDIQQTKKELQEVIANLEQKKELKPKEEARIYRGYKGLKTGLTEAVQNIPEKGEYLFFSTGYGQVSQFRRLFQTIAKELKKRKISIKGLAHTKEKLLYHKHYNKLGYKMSYTEMKWPSDISIIGNYVATIVWDGETPILYLIHSAVLAKSYQQFFQSLSKH